MGLYYRRLNFFIGYMLHLAGTDFTLDMSAESLVYSE